MNIVFADTHCHLDSLDLNPYGDDLTSALRAARDVGVKYILCPGIDLEHMSRVLSVTASDSDLFATIGVHPTEQDARQPSVEELVMLGQDPKIVGVGETGLDFYHEVDRARRQEQVRLFKLHIRAAQELKKPLIIHARDADLEVGDILRSTPAATCGGILHCFTGGLELARLAIELGFYIGFSGIITFRNADNLRSIARAIPRERILLETDAPYLAPEPVRGVVNEPRYLPYIATFMAKLLDKPVVSLAQLTTQNFLRFLGYPLA